MTGRLLILDAELDGRRTDLRIENGRIAEIGARLGRDGTVLDAGGGALVPGLHDHHIHLLALAAALESVDVSPERIRGAGALQRTLAAPTGTWVRAINYHDDVAGPLDRTVLDRLAPERPVRVQYGTGSLWVLNGPALAAVLKPGEPLPPCVETDPAGEPTGRVWRGDDWLRTRLPATPPDLGRVGALLARMGVTGASDTSAGTGPAEAALLAEAARSGALPQRLTLMSGESLDAPDDGAVAVGPVKILLDERDLPDFGAVLDRVRQARAWRRRVAFHCVTPVELAFVLAVMDTAGARPGDRIEHGSLIPAAAIKEIARLGLTVVTQPGLVGERGDRYRAEIDAREWPDLYRCRSLLEAGIPVAFSTDAPYTAPDPWAAIRTAASRRTPSGAVLGAAEAVSAAAALRRFLGPAHLPGAPPRRLVAGAPADLCLLGAPLDRALATKRPAVAATLVGGAPVHLDDAGRLAATTPIRTITEVLGETP
ncbi:MAG: amidohydrolase family protein [Alphaproteobacteria bacterium]|nr:amidohydrolase family protein [Alphaproteobacteria bacterium]